MPTKMNEEQSKLSRAPVLNFSFTDCGGSFAPALTARKLGTIQRIRLVCCPSPGANVSELADELLEVEEFCCPSGAAEGVGASGNAVAAISVRCEAGDRGNPARSCATPGIGASRQIKPVMRTRIHLQLQTHSFANLDKSLMHP